jgi:uridine kinase
MPDIKVTLKTEGDTSGAEKVNDALREVGETAAETGGAMDGVMGGGWDGKTKGGGGGPGSGAGDPTERLKDFGKLLSTLNTLKEAAGNVATGVQSMREQVARMSGDTKQEFDALGAGLGVVQSTLQGFATGGVWGAVAGAAKGMIDAVMGEAKFVVDQMETEIGKSKEKIADLDKYIKDTAKQRFEEQAKAAERAAAREEEAATRAVNALKEQIETELTLRETQARTEEEMDKARLARIRASDATEAEKIQSAAAVEMNALARKAEMEAKATAGSLKIADTATKVAEDRASKAYEAYVRAQQTVADLEAKVARLNELRAKGQGNSPEAWGLKDDEAALESARKQLDKLAQKAEKVIDEHLALYDDLQVGLENARAQMDADASLFAAKAVGIAEEAKGAIQEKAEAEAQAFVDQAASFTEAGATAGGKVKEASTQWKDAVDRIARAMEDGLQPPDYQVIMAALATMKATHEGRNKEQAAQIGEIEKVMRDYNATMRQQSEKFLDIGRQNTDLARQNAAATTALSQEQAALKQQFQFFQQEVFRRLNSQ